ncbi:MAG TPA: class I SAM-dependent methyltransferase [Candidatus Acidoferrales bacterium]|nr:class I SAM-dependent methyltransferase [Candidatus Acidoferrales bacterium]
MRHLIDYYAKRAREYDRLYDKTERQADLGVLKDLCARWLASHRVLEIACGTGYWTQAASHTAESILATDINPEMLELARAKAYFCPVCFRQADVFDLNPLAVNDFTAGLAMAWWSHLRKSELHRFLNGYHRVFRPGAVLVYMDNRFVPGSSTPISRIDDEGNTFQIRRLEDGSQYEVLKNFPSENEVKGLLAGVASEICWTELQYYWFLKYRLG